MTATMIGRMRAGFVVGGVALAAAVVATAYVLVETDRETEGKIAAFTEKMARTPLVRICADGTRIYRRDGTLLLVHAFGETPFAPDIALEQACPSR